MPWLVGVFEDFKYICAGTIITDRLVISSAQCFQEVAGSEVNLKNLSSLAIVAGKFKRQLNVNESTNQTFNVQNVKTSNTNNSDNIAVVTLQTSLNFNNIIRPICLDYDKALGLENRLPIGESDKIASWNGNYIKTVEMTLSWYEMCKTTTYNDTRYFAQGEILIILFYLQQVVQLTFLYFYRQFLCQKSLKQYKHRHRSWTIFPKNRW